jgi:pyruvate-ferredoxin/flavodoxin oxidoreductase
MAPKGKVQDFMLSENRFKMLTKSRPEEAKTLFARAQTDIERRWKFYQSMQARDCKLNMGEPTTAKPAATTPAATVSEQP